MPRSPRSLAARKVVPDPKNGSRTNPWSGANASHDPSNCGKRFLIGVKVFMLPLPSNRVNNRSRRRCRSALRQKKRGFMPASRKMSKSRHIFHETKMTHQAKADALPGPNKGLSMRPTVKANSKTVRPQHSIDFRKDGLKPGQFFVADYGGRAYYRSRLRYPTP